MTTRPSRNCASAFKGFGMSEAGLIDTASDPKTLAATELIASVLRQGGTPCVTSSFQTECVALVHMIVEQAPGIPVLFLDTGYHFPETLAYRDKIVAQWNL